jgi:hypothetical protein
MNLGSFASGAVQGYQSQERLNLAQSEAADNKQFRERSMKMQEQNQGNQQDQIDRQNKMRAAVADSYAQNYGMQDVQDGESVQDDGQGGVTKVPTMKKVQISPGMDTARDAKVFADTYKAQAMYGSTDPAHMQAMFDAVQKSKSTTLGKSLLATLSGSDASIGELGKQLGKTPAQIKGAALNFHPDKNIQQIDWGDGSSTDLKQQAAAVGASDAWTALHGQVQDAQGVARVNAETANLGASANLHNATAAATTAEMPSKIKLNESHADYFSSVGQDRIDNHNAAQSDKRAKDSLGEIRAVIGEDPMAMDPKATNKDQATYLMTRSADLRASGATGTQVGQANKEWMTQSDAFDTAFKNLTTGMSKDAIKAKFGDPRALKAKTMRDSLNNSSPKSNLAASAD